MPGLRTINPLKVKVIMPMGAPYPSKTAVQ
jgi:hypothetical protein